jgi:transcriptional regulator with XRE-family HTH domain
MTHREDDPISAHAKSGCAFGCTLRLRRLKVGLSQNNLARRAGIDQAYVNRMERAPASSSILPSRHVALALAESLGLDWRQRDRFLFAASLAPKIDWQSRAENAESRLRQVVSAVRDWPESWTLVEEAEER